MADTEFYGFDTVSSTIQRTATPEDISNGPSDGTLIGVSQQRVILSPPRLERPPSLLSPPPQGWPFKRREQGEITSFILPQHPTHEPDSAVLVFNFGSEPSPDQKKTLSDIFGKHGFTLQEPVFYHSGSFLRAQYTIPIQSYQDVGKLAAAATEVEKAFNYKAPTTDMGGLNI